MGQGVVHQDLNRQPSNRNPYIAKPDESARVPVSPPPSRGGGTWKVPAWSAAVACCVKAHRLSFRFLQCANLASGTPSSEASDADTIASPSV